MKKILGLDVGTNSVGWSLIQHDFECKKGNILGMGSRILPMTQDLIGNFNKGVLQSSAAQRTQFRGMRRLRERSLNRRERLLKVLKILGLLDQGFSINEHHSVAYEVVNDSRVFKFENSYQEMKNIFLEKNPKNTIIPKDWTIYYLREKALKEKISEEELVWVILQFNTKRGYYQLRGDQELNTEGDKYFINDIVDNITEVDKSRGNITFEIELRSGIKGLFSSKEEPKWIGKYIDFIVSEKTLKSGDLKVTFSSPGVEDWTLRKKKTESDIHASGKTVGEYIFDSLLNNPLTKIRGEYVHTIDRIHYKNELLKILNEQSKYHDKLNDSILFKLAAETLYKNNINHRTNLLSTSITHMIVEDIIFYQRPLKSKKHLVANCKYENYNFNHNGQSSLKQVKGTPKSNPLFQEYKLWSLIHNIRILEKEHRNEAGILKFNEDVSHKFLDEDKKAGLFELFNFKKELTHKQILKFMGLSSNEYRINYEEDKALKGNETFGEIISAGSTADMKKRIEKILNNSTIAQRIWHAIYSLTDSLNDLANALSHPDLRLEDDIIQALSSVSPFKKDYSSLSEKAIKKMLPLMRCGKYWKESEIHPNVLKRIEAIINAEEDTSISKRVRENLNNLNSVSHFQGLPEYLASYVVYNIHSELENIKRYDNPEDIDVNKLIPQHSLRNPVVEKILRETMLVVKDIWANFGRPDEIHLEMARELKLPNEARKKYTQKRNENENNNRRALAMLRELQKDYTSINPYSIGQLELFKLYEEGATNNENFLEDDIKAIRRKGDPSPSELNRYKLWLDQKYKSPYTGQPIPLSKLFTTAYEIEHVIPKSLYYDDSFNNKIICEREANRLKDNSTAYEFICSKGGTKLSTGSTILEKDEYEKLVLSMFIGKRTKIKNLLSYDVPKSFNQAQLNNTRYISKKLLTLLNPVVKEENENDWKSKNLIPMVGGITSKLKKSWGLNKVWKKILEPRFIRMNEITNTTDYHNKKDGKTNLSGNETELKRLDHRHHALDALIIACTAVQHIQYIETYQDKKIRYDLIPKLFKKDDKDQLTSDFLKPWKNFNKEVLDQLQTIIPSFKQNLRVINRTKNYYLKYTEKNGNLKKEYFKQKKSAEFWSIRQSLHKATVYGKRTIREYKEISLLNAIEDISKVADKHLRKELKKRLLESGNEISKLKKSLKAEPILQNGKAINKVQIIYENEEYSSSRKLLDTNITKKIIEEKVLDQQIKRVLLNHLAKYKDDPLKAFDPNGLIALNESRKVPIKKVTVVESFGKKFKLGDRGVNRKKFVEADKGTNLFFVIYRNSETNENLITPHSTINFFEVLEKLKLNLPIAENKDGYETIILSPGDLVYALDENESPLLPEKLDVSKIYKCVSFSKQQCFFIQNNVASTIENAKEFGPLNKQEKSIEGNFIKKNFIKLKINRLGIISQ